MAGALAMLGVDRALVVAGHDGMDEISVTAPTSIVEVNGQEITSYTLQPPDVGIELATGDSAEAPLRGGSPEENAAVTRAILAGDRTNGHDVAVDLAVINAGAAIYVAGRADTIADGVQAAREAIADGAAAEALARYVSVSNALAPEAVR
jgi:anthranilate phosphoribosyltransferase